MARALSEIRTSIQQEKRQRAELGFDDLLSRLDGALQSGGGEQLAQAIRQRYPVAMIDEFRIPIRSNTVFSKSFTSAGPIAACC